MCYTESTGRHLIAERKICPGEVVAVDVAALQVLTLATKMTFMAFFNYIAAIMTL